MDTASRDFTNMQINGLNCHYKDPLQAVGTWYDYVLASLSSHNFHINML